MTIILWDYESVWRDIWPQNKCRSLWPIFHGSSILSYILKTVWCMTIILRFYESVWPDLWPQNNCRSLWPIFHGPVILPYILKTIRCMNIILWDYESVWLNIWPQNKCRSLWPIFHGPEILPYILKTVVWTSYFWIMSQFDITFHLKINVGHCDLYFKVHWFLPYILKTVWCMNIILQDYETVWPDIWLKMKCKSLWPIFHGPVISPYILKIVWCMNILLQHYESVWPDIWLQNKCRLLWPVFHAPMILPCNLKTLLHEHHTLGLWVSMARHLTSK